MSDLASMMTRAGYSITSSEAHGARVVLDGVAYLRCGRATRLIRKAAGVPHPRAYGLLQSGRIGDRIRTVMVNERCYLYNEDDVAGLARQVANEATS
jgi:hypothetical protein